MNTSRADLPPVATDVEVTREHLRIHFADGRRLEVPLSWFPRLCGAEASALSEWRLSLDGAGIHWPVLDEDVSIAGLLAGRGACTNPRGGAA